MYYIDKYGDAVKLNSDRIDRIYKIPFDGNKKFDVVYNSSHILGKEELVHIEHLSNKKEASLFIYWLVTECLDDMVWSTWGEFLEFSERNKDEEDEEEG